MGAALLIIAVSTAVIVMAKLKPYLFVWWMWYAIAIALILGILQIIDIRVVCNGRPLSLPSLYQHCHDACQGYTFYDSMQKNRKIFYSRLQYSFLTVITGVSWQPCSCWRNRASLWSHALTVTMNNDLVIFVSERFSLETDHMNKALLISMKPPVCNRIIERPIMGGNLLS